MHVGLNLRKGKSLTSALVILLRQIGLHVVLEMGLQPVVVALFDGLDYSERVAPLLEVRSLLGLFEELVADLAF